MLERDSVILLENALIDTSVPRALNIPEAFRAHGDPGAYIVQARPGALADAVRRATQLGAQPVSFIPNNAWLVRASAALERSLAEVPEIAAIVPFEPWFKLQPELLASGASTFGQSQADLRVLLFPDSGLPSVHGVEVLTSESCSFGTILRVRVVVDPRDAILQLARSPEVQAIERVTPRMPANDLSRAVLGISASAQVETNWLGLTGSNVLVHVSDTGVDAAHPDLAGRVVADAAASGSDSDQDGHGTHVAGIIAGDGRFSAGVVTASGSPLPASTNQFRGKAPAARLLSTAALATSGQSISDLVLQQTAARSNALISLHSWRYESGDYDLSASSYDAATRDALPEVPGAQPILPVFAAGGFDMLSETEPGRSVRSPGTAKNGITVGVSENARGIASWVWRMVSTNGGSQPVTNQVWLPMTDSSAEVWSSSPQLNVGVGVEGVAGRMKPDVVAPGTFVISARSGQWDEQDYYAALSSSPGNAGLVLSNLNRELGPGYRYESGSSMAAAQVAGTLALLQEFLARKTGTTPSPALLKAFLLNGARPLDGPPPDPGSSRNPQGWGRPLLTHSIPAALARTNLAGPVVFLEQDSAHSLGTGQCRAWELAVAPSARTAPLRFTLVWTDPPANPLAAVKLVNNLDLIVTNLDSGEVFAGNVLGSNGYSVPLVAGSVTDRVNNVEQVLLRPGTASRYSVAVRAARVNAASGAGALGTLTQDFALVISSDAATDLDALTLGAPAVTSTPEDPAAEPLASSSSASGVCAWTVLTGEKVSASSPWPATNTVPLPDGQGVLTLGDPTSWKIYTFTNHEGCTNLAIATFNAQRQARIFPGTNEQTEADVDLFVSSNSGLSQLEPGALAEAWTSLRRGGRETIVFTNAEPLVYYIAVKSQSQAGAETALLVVTTDEPFAELDSSGNLAVRGFPFAAPIPDASGAGPGVLHVMGVAPMPLPLRRVIVSNLVTHPRHGDLRAALSHKGKTVTLRVPDNDAHSGSRHYVFDDSLENDSPGALPGSGPGSLREFAGDDAWGQWLLTLSDEVPGGAGTNDAWLLQLQPQPDLQQGASISLEPLATSLHTLWVPAAATNLNLHVNSPLMTGSVHVELRRRGDVLSAATDVDLDEFAAEPVITSSKYSLPALNPGLHEISIRNNLSEPAIVEVRAEVREDEEPAVPVTYSWTGPEPIPDQAWTRFPLASSLSGRLASVAVGLRIDHPRVSDLALRLVSPSGRAVLLIENRGGTSAEGLGLDNIVTNTVPVSSEGGAEAYTNIMSVGYGAGTVEIAYEFWTLPDFMRVYRGPQLIFDSGFTPGAGQWTIPYDEDPSGTLTVVMNEGDNFDPNTYWKYTVTSARFGFLHAVFAENTNLAPLLVKFVSPPFTNAGPADPLLATNAPFYQPEESLDAFVGETAAGTWALEVIDRSEGPGGSAGAALKSWELHLLVDTGLPLPIDLAHGAVHTASIPAGQVRPYRVDVPAWANFATNDLVGASGPVQLWFNASMPPTATNAGDRLLLPSATVGQATLSATSNPQIQSNTTYFVSLVNTGSQAISTTFKLEFDMLPLARNTTIPVSLPFGPLPRYFRLEVSPHLASFALDLTNVNGNLDLVLSRGPRLPILGFADFTSNNPGGEPETILVSTDSVPVPLEPGPWYVGIYNAGENPASGTLIHRETAAPLVVFVERAEPNQVRLSWQGPSGYEYEVHWSPTVQPPIWSPFPSVITSASGWFYFTDDGSVPGGPQQTRFYRVVQRDPAR